VVHSDSAVGNCPPPLRSYGERHEDHAEPRATECACAGVEIARRRMRCPVYPRQLRSFAALRRPDGLLKQRLCPLPSPVVRHVNLLCWLYASVSAPVPHLVTMLGASDAAPPVLKITKVHPCAEGPGLHMSRLVPARRSCGNPVDRTAQAARDLGANRSAQPPPSSVHTSACFAHAVITNGPDGRSRQKRL